MCRTRTANGSAERGPGGGGWRRGPQARGESSANGRASTSRAPERPRWPLAVMAGRVQSHTRLPGAREGRPLEWWGGCSEAGLGDSGRLLWRALILPTWVPERSLVGLVPVSESRAISRWLPWNLLRMPFREGAYCASRPAPWSCGPISTSSRIISYKTCMWCKNLEYRLSLGGRFERGTRESDERLKSCLDLRGSYRGVYICKNSSSLTLNISALNALCVYLNFLK